MVKRYKVADIVFDAEYSYDYTERLCQAYEYCGNEPSVAKFKITELDIVEEKVAEPTFPDALLESLSLFRKLCHFALESQDSIIFHSSAIAVDGKAYLFTAPSGTGKSTHTRLWRELLGDRAVMINDDKPIIRYTDGKFYVYGTPWTGKHNLGTNTRAEVKAICKISQAKENVIQKVSAGQMLITVMNQTMRPVEPKKMDKLLTLIDKMLSQVGLYSLGCTISLEGAKLSFETMSGEKL